MTRVLVVGSGIAGLWTAIRVAEAGCDVTVVTKAALGAGATAWAQGGIAAAIFAGDAPARHAADTLAAGAGLADPRAVRILTDEGPARIRDLIRFGVAFDRDESGIARGLEAAHSRARILHAGGDATGAAIQAALVATVRRRGIRVREHTTLVDLVVDSGRVTGIRVISGDRDDAAASVAPRAPLELRADAVVLATGGSGCLYRYTTNPDVATGDGVAAAARAGAEVADLEFVQFHPTALAVAGTPLISEAVRGEGAVLRDAAGRRFLLEVDPRAELAPRDVVARAVWRRMAEQGGTPVVLDATRLGASRLASRFPGIDAACRRAGFDWSIEPVPVVPAAHYSMGGVATDLSGRTSLPGLWAVGEVARTGVHGANRLASNSLLEGAVFAERAARDVAGSAPAPAPASSARGRLASTPAPAPAAAPATAAVDRAELQQLMWDHVGLERDAAGLAEASARLDAWQAPEPVDRRTAEDRNLLDVARLTVAAALARAESVGAHTRRDAAPAVAAPDREAA